MVRAWKNIGHADKKHEAGSILSLQISTTWSSIECDKNAIQELDNPKKAPHWQTVDTPKENAFYLILWKQLHFGQAKGTPFTIHPMVEEFDWAANSRQSELVLEGSYANSELLFIQNKLLEHCKKERNANIIGNKISVEEWKDKIQ
eukprot:2254504-Ditylum_brightwellii.AAC.1